MNQSVYHYFKGFKPLGSYKSSVPTSDHLTLGKSQHVHKNKQLFSLQNLLEKVWFGKIETRLFPPKLKG